MAEVPAPIILTLTYPPTANNMFSVVRGRKIKSREYRAWEELNLGLMSAERFQTIRVPSVFRMRATPPNRQRRDLSNIVKAVEDLCQKAGAISDDCLFHKLDVQWVFGPGAGVTVTIEPLGAAS